MLSAAVVTAALGAAAASPFSEDTSLMEDVIDPRFLIIINGTNNSNLLNYLTAGLAIALLVGTLLALAFLALSMYGGGNDTHPSSYGGYGNSLNRYDDYDSDTYANYNQGFEARSLGGSGKLPQ